MGLFDKLFGGSDKPKQVDSTPWIDLNAMEQLDTIVEQSKSKPQLIFKHSTRCGISRMVIGQFKKDYTLTETKADLYYLDLIAHRDISNAVAKRFDVHHESPQLLVVKNGVVVKHESHGGINDVALEQLV
jgi:bacillithiol system protein YtxJ